MSWALGLAPAGLNQVFAPHIDMAAESGRSALPWGFSGSKC